MKINSSRTKEMRTVRWQTLGSVILFLWTVGLYIFRVRDDFPYICIVCNWCDTSICFLARWFQRAVPLLSRKVNIEIYSGDIFVDLFIVQ
jgi:hypothetical protein